MKTNELRDLTVEELGQRYEETRQELFNLRLQQATGQLEKATRLRILRRDVARILTLLRQRREAGQ